MLYPKGYLIAVGGSEDKGEDEILKKNKVDFFEQGILKQIVELAGKKGKPRIEIITTASSIPDEVGATYKRAFKKLGVEDAGHMKIQSRQEADNPKFLERIEKCSGVLFSGGDQLKLCSILGGTDLMDIIQDRYEDEPFVIAGTSAGAAAMSNSMMSGGNEARAYLKGEVQLTIGFGLLRDIIIDTHFDARGRFGRLIQAIAAQPGSIGVGLDEDTGVVIERGHKLKAIGSGSVVVIDGAYVTHNNIADIRDGMPLSISNVQVHVMTNSDIFDVASREFTPVKFDLHHA